MMENGFVSARNTAFPAGLRVLVVDDDPTWLKILEKMLKKCSYEVTTCCLATDALGILRKRKDKFDIVISDVNMPDMDGFKLLEHVGLEMNLPVIMMSVDGEISRVMKGVLHGACDYLLKPIRMKELQNIWQHVLRKKIHEVKDVELSEGTEGIQKMRNGSDIFDDGHLLAGGDLTCARKRKDLENYELDDQDFSDSSSAKKARVVWSVDLHKKFVNAVNQIGLDKVGPKKILDLMNVPWLTRENVASHLQKYRLYLSRLQKQGPSFGATLHPDFSCMDPSSSFSLQSSPVMHQNNATSCSFGYSDNKMLVQEVDSGSRMALADSLGPRLNGNCTLYEPNTPQHHQRWGGDGPMIQFTQPKEEHELPRYTPGPEKHIQEDLMRAALSVNLGTSIKETDKINLSELKPSNAVYSGNHVRIGSVQAPTHAAKTEVFDSLSTCIVSPSTRNQSYDQCGSSNWGTQQQDFIVGSGPTVASCPSFQDLGYIENVGLSSTLGFSNYLGPEIVTELPIHFLDGLRFNSDFLFDSIDYPSINEGLFIT